MNYLETSLVFTYSLSDAFHNVSVLEINSQQSDKSKRQKPNVRISYKKNTTYLNSLMNLITTMKLNFLPVVSSDFSHKWPSIS